MSQSITSKLARFNPFKTKESDDDDAGFEIDASTLAGGGHSARPTDLVSRLRVSHVLKSFLAHHGVLSEEDVDQPGATESLRALLDKPHIDVPADVTDRSHPLPHYFISSSHNTYLMAHQLYGTSSAAAYETALNTGSRCVEIDAWDNEDDRNEPKVTHGFTLVSHIPFRAICETIRDIVDKEAAQAVNEQGYRAAPVMLSLENHCDANGQMRLVEIMKEVWGDRLLSKAVRERGHQEQEGVGDHVRLDELGSKIVVIVEYHLPNEQDSGSSSESSESEDETEKTARKSYKEKKKATQASGIIPELAELGVYAQSVKPSDSSWYDPGDLKNGPHHHLINVSETGLAAHMPAQSEKIARHNANHLMRVYPKGTRISSRNLKPVPFWGVGAQICALNWQTFGASMQLNEALFSGTDGYVLKPLALRSADAPLGTGRTKRLRLHVAGASDVPLPEGRDTDDIRLYVTSSLIHPNDVGKESQKRKTKPFKHHKLGFLHRGENPPLTDPVWDDTLEWEYEENEMAFLRLLIKSDDSMSRNPVFAVSAVRLLYVVRGEWRFVRMLDLKGRETLCSLLVKFDFGDV